MDNFLGISFLDDDAGTFVAGIGTAGASISLLTRFNDSRTTATTLKCLVRAKCIALASTDTLIGAATESRLDDGSERGLLADFRKQSANRADLAKRLRRAFPGVSLIVRDPERWRARLNGSSVSLSLSSLFSDDIAPRIAWHNLLEACICAELARQYANATQD